MLGEVGGGRVALLCVGGGSGGGSGGQPEQQAARYYKRSNSGLENSYAEKLFLYFHTTFSSFTVVPLPDGLTSSLSWLHGVVY